MAVVGVRVGVVVDGGKDENLILGKVVVVVVLGVVMVVVVLLVVKEMSLLTSGTPKGITD